MGRLAGYLGWSDEQIETRMSVRELNSWRVREQVEPYGERRMDLRFGLLASLIANVHRDPKQRPRPWQPWEVFPLFPKPQPPTPDQLVRKLQVMFGDPELTDGSDIEADR